MLSRGSDKEMPWGSLTCTRQRAARGGCCLSQGRLRYASVTSELLATTPTPNDRKQPRLTWSSHCIPTAGQSLSPSPGGDTGPRNSHQVWSEERRVRGRLHWLSEPSAYISLAQGSHSPLCLPLGMGMHICAVWEGGRAGTLAHSPGTGGLLLYQTG